MKNPINFLSVILMLSVSLTTLAEEQYGNLLGCDYLDMTSGQERGQTFLNLMKETVKPKLDDFALGSYRTAGGYELVYALDRVEKKVKRQALGSLKGSNESEKKANLKKLGAKLQGRPVNLYVLPNILGSYRDLVSDRYKLSTYIGLVSCGGVTMKFADDNYAYNVHYGTGAEDKDDRTGRSFGASRVFHATDSSYSHYLKMLEEYVTTSPENTEHFYQTIMEVLTNSEPRRYDKVNDLGDSVLTDFFAIWTAEQVRNLMDGRVRPHWDAALLQVTLLAAFHAGQEEIKLFYVDPLDEDEAYYFTDNTFSLAWPRRNRSDETCEVNEDSRRFKQASLTDYIGVHYRTYEHCGRSGVNMSRDEWGRLGKKITTYLKNHEQGKKILNKVEKNMNLSSSFRGERDIYRELSKFLISDRAPSSVRAWKRFSDDMVELLMFTQKHAKEITAELEGTYTLTLEIN